MTRSAGRGHLLPPIIRSSAGDGSVWWHTLIFHFHFDSTCCLGVRHTNGGLRMKGKDSHAHCFHQDHRLLLWCNFCQLCAMCSLADRTGILVVHCSLIFKKQLRFCESNASYSGVAGGRLLSAFRCASKIVRVKGARPECTSASAFLTPTCPQVG